MVVSRNNKSKWNWLLEAGTFSIVGLSSYLFFRLVHSHGWNGAFRYIWEGDPLPQQLRAFVNTLKAASLSLDEHDASILVFEEGLERARLGLLDQKSQNTRASILHRWRTNLPHMKQDIRKHLATLSSYLDDLASNIDQVPCKDEIRVQKKELSSRIVRLMSRTDQLIEFFTIATSTAN